MATPRAAQDARFGEPEAPATRWAEAEAALRDAELYWLTTVRADGRPHTTPLVGVWHDDGFWFCTGEEEQKQRNLERNDAVTVTTGANAWQRGLDLVVEGVAQRVTGDLLPRVADAYREKYGAAWDFATDGEVFRHGGGTAFVFRVAPRKVLAFGKEPHSQTAFRF